MKFNINFMTSLFLLLPFCSPANEIYDCKAVGGSVLEYDIYKKKFNSEHSKDKDLKVTFVVSKNGAFLKSNNGKSDLKKLTDGQFYETAQKGNAIFWTLIKLTDENKTILFQHKAYKMAGAASFTTIFDCE